MRYDSGFDYKDQNDFAELQLRHEILDVLKSVRYSLDEITFNVKAECVNCLEAKRKARDHKIRYRAEQMANRVNNLES